MQILCLNPFLIAIILSLKETFFSSVDDYAILYFFFH